MELGGWRPQSEITVLDSDSLLRVPRDQQTGLRQLVDALGEASARAQRLPSVITTYDKLRMSGNQRLYLVARDGLGLGLLKMGVKKLFVRTETGRTVEMDPLCCLDFYVHESQQRRGMGKRVFEYMLHHEAVEPRKLAYDRPSPKLIGFMAKHYRLSSFVPQPNHYVVFDQYFDDRPASSRANRSVSSRPLSSTKRRRGGKRDPGLQESLATSLEGLGQSTAKPRSHVGRPSRNSGGPASDTGQWGGGLGPIRGPGAMGSGGLPFEHISMAEQNRVPRVPKLDTGRAAPKSLRQVGGSSSGNADAAGGRLSSNARSNEADFTRQLREQQLTSATDRQVMNGGMTIGRDDFPIGSIGGDRGGRGNLPDLRDNDGGTRRSFGQHSQPAQQLQQQQQQQQQQQPSFLDRIEQQAKTTGLRSLNDPTHFTPDAPLPRQRSMPSSSRSMGPGPVPQSYLGRSSAGANLGGQPSGSTLGPGSFGRQSYSQPSSVGGMGAKQQASRVRGVQGSFLSTSLW